MVGEDRVAERFMETALSSIHIVASQILPVVPSIFASGKFDKVACDLCSPPGKAYREKCEHSDPKKCTKLRRGRRKNILL